MHCLLARRREVTQGMVFKRTRPLRNTHFVNNGGNDTLQAACELVRLRMQ
jgi:hypothetical protein